MFSKTAFVFAFFAVARLATATPPACLLAAVNECPDPSDLEAVCGDYGSDVQSFLGSNCGDYEEDAMSAFDETCSSAGHSVGTFTLGPFTTIRLPEQLSLTYVGIASYSATATGSATRSGHSSTGTAHASGSASASASGTGSMPTYGSGNATITTGSLAPTSTGGSEGGSEGGASASGSAVPTGSDGAAGRIEMGALGALAAAVAGLAAALRPFWDMVKMRISPVQVSSGRRKAMWIRGWYRDRKLHTLESFGKYDKCVPLSLKLVDGYWSTSLMPATGMDPK
ncbi:hypothetical protein BDY21DRAFT_360583 [Lineolata rhizophorae]|uniref:Extracellular membrane protein CFEM domain-containing protein n=1 Tax=Lineolata rhizophorae TaxID=578093 RepID=A0A6A6PCB0_9PEZI|nr:hypothetical protein BDY21DRAFT_360583 [Lineolata rhizophorae]